MEDNEPGSLFQGWKELLVVVSPSVPIDSRILRFSHHIASTGLRPNFSMPSLNLPRIPTQLAKRPITLYHLYPDSLGLL